MRIERLIDNNGSTIWLPDRTGVWLGLKNARPIAVAITAYGESGRWYEVDHLPNATSFRWLLIGP